MRLLAISGSTRHGSTNTALLRAMAQVADPKTVIEVFDSLASLPIFSPDSNVNTPVSVQQFAASVASADGLIISSPEYVRAIPGGLKNAIDWLVPREELINKPIALVHASHRGDDMLRSLRLVLNTVTGNFDETSFLRFPLMAKSPEEVIAFLQRDECEELLNDFLSSYSAYILALRNEN